jgi:hypothetical protein
MHRTPEYRLSAGGSLPKVRQAITSKQFVTKEKAAMADTGGQYRMGVCVRLSHLDISGVS